MKAIKVISLILVIIVFCNSPKIIAQVPENLYDIPFGITNDGIVIDSIVKPQTLSGINAIACLHFNKGVPKTSMVKEFELYIANSRDTVVYKSDSSTLTKEMKEAIGHLEFNSLVAFQKIIAFYESGKPTGVKMLRFYVRK